MRKIVGYILNRLFFLLAKEGISRKTVFQP